MFCRCLDNSGGYLHHTPAVAAKIITACVCLHNIARIHAFPLPPHEDHEDEDAQRSGMRNVRQEPPQIAPREVPRAEHVARRQQFIARNFAHGRRGRQRPEE